MTQGETMDATQMQEIRLRVMEAVARARAAAVSLAAAVEAIMSNTARLTPEARTSDATALVAERRATIQETAEQARGILRGGYAVVDAEISRLVNFSDVERDEAHRALEPILRASATGPELLLNLYRKRHRDNAARFLIEEQAAVAIDAIGDLDNFEFRNAWDALQEELAAERGPEELEANARRSELDALGLYVDAAEAVAMIDLALMGPASELGNEERGRLGIQRSMAEATVNRYENEHASNVLA